nr:Fe3+ hydroxamate ABC transporter substrate-binding protein [Melghiribacillus thermohalophilus]
MFGNVPRCIECDKEIKGGDVVFIKMRFPEHKGMTEIKSYLKHAGSFICENCFPQKAQSDAPDHSKT